MYIHSPTKDRENRFRYAVKEMGGTIVAGAITTAGSGAMMFNCQLGFFYKMAVLISGTIFLSFTFTMLYFTPLLAAAGPSGSMGSITCSVGKAESEKRRETQEGNSAGMHRDKFHDQHSVYAFSSGGRESGTVRRRANKGETKVGGTA